MKKNCLKAIVPLSVAGVLLLLGGCIKFALKTCGRLLKRK